MKAKYIKPVIYITTISKANVICTSATLKYVNSGSSAVEAGDGMLNALDAMLAKDRAEVENDDENFDW